MKRGGLSNPMSPAISIEGIPEGNVREFPKALSAANEPVAGGCGTKARDPYI